MPDKIGDKNGFRVAVTEQNKRWGINKPIHFPSGTVGLIRSITGVEMGANGTVYVVGTCRITKLPEGEV